MGRWNTPVSLPMGFPYQSRRGVSGDSNTQACHTRANGFALVLATNAVPVVEPAADDGGAGGDIDGFERQGGTADAADAADAACGWSAASLSVPIHCCTISSVGSS
eukprot:SAG11_NODE_20737_length_439_cov_0.914706_1_plen_105_part_10